MDEKTSSEMHDIASNGVDGKGVDAKEVEVELEEEGVKNKGNKLLYDVESHPPVDIIIIYAIQVRLFHCIEMVSQCLNSFI